MAKHIKINLSSKEEKLLKALLKRKKIAKDLAIRINIVLMSHQTKTYSEIMSELGCTSRPISHWKHRWYFNHEKLKTFIKGFDGDIPTDNEIKKEILTILGDAPRSGKPITFKEAIRKKIMLVACESPEKYALPFSHWTHIELAKQVIKLKIVDSISARHLGRILKKTI